jgi:hypothetical protein
VKVHGVQEAISEVPEEKQRRDQGDGGPLAGRGEGRHLVPVLVVKFLEAGEAGEERGEKEEGGGHVDVAETTRYEDEYKMSGFIKAGG